MLRWPWDGRTLASAHTVLHDSPQWGSVLHPGVPSICMNQQLPGPSGPRFRTPWVLIWSSVRHWTGCSRWRRQPSLVTFTWAGTLIQCVGSCHSCYHISRNLGQQNRCLHFWPSCQASMGGGSCGSRQLMTTVKAWLNLRRALYESGGELTHSTCASLATW